MLLLRKITVVPYYQVVIPEFMQTRLITTMYMWSAGTPASTFQKNTTPIMIFSYHRLLLIVTVMESRLWCGKDATSWMQIAYRRSTKVILATPKAQKNLSLNSAALESVPEIIES